MPTPCAYTDMYATYQHSLVYTFAGGPTFRPKVIAAGGKAQFPYLVDKNTNVAIYESDEIVAYLFQQYGDGNVPKSLEPSFWTTLSCSIAMLPRLGKGSRFNEAKQPKNPLVYWGYESSPFCKLVRERLVELEIPHVQKSSGRGSSKRQQLFDKTGRFQVPYLEDPNTGVSLFESQDILDYLNEVYAI
jgi:glutathione S-transferase